MGETKIFESDGFVVTTERFIYGSNVIPLDNISSAMAFVDRNWGGMLVIAVIGLAIFSCGIANSGIILILIGIMVLVGAYFLFQYTIERKVLVRVNEEGLWIEVATSELGYNLANAINTGIAGRKQARMNNLQNEISNLPSW